MIFFPFSGQKLRYTILQDTMTKFCVVIGQIRNSWYQEAPTTLLGRSNQSIPTFDDDFILVYNIICQTSSILR